MNASAYAQKLAAMAADNQKKEEPQEEVKEAIQETSGSTESPSANPDELTPESFLTKLPGGPTVEQIQSWRDRYSSIYILPLRDDDWYVWRYLERKEWKDIQAQAVGVNPGEVEQFMQTQVLGKCVIWPREKVLVPENNERLPAGLIDLLYEVIMTGSYFLQPEQALQRVIRL